MKKGQLIAGAVASLFAVGALAEDKPAAKKEAKETSAQVKCTGINECKGKGSCHGAGNSCAGANACKGKGVTMTTEANCKAKKGTILAEKK